MATLTNQEIQFAYQKSDALAEDLPIKVSYAITRTKNKYLKPEIESFQEETNDLDRGSDEFQEHLSHEVEVEAHNVSASHLDGHEVAPAVFVGLDFLFSEREDLEPVSKEIQKGELVSVINALQQVSGTDCTSGQTVMEVASALTLLQNQIGEVHGRLSEINEKIDEADEDEVPEVIEERQEFLSEPVEVELTSVDIDTLVQENDINVTPATLEGLRVVSGD